MSRADITPPGDYGPGDYGSDLNPDFLAGQNYGLEGPHPIKSGHVKTAYDIKNLHDRMSEFTDDELKNVPILPAGERLEQGATYIDLRERHPREFTAVASMVSDEGNWYVPKSDVGYALWNRLIGVTNPERLDQADEGASDKKPSSRTAQAWQTGQKPARQASGRKSKQSEKPAQTLARGEPIAEPVLDPSHELPAGADTLAAKPAGEPVPERADTSAADWAGEAATGWAGREFPQPQGNTGELY